jgi:hypothetical protein
MREMGPKDDQKEAVCLKMFLNETIIERRYAFILLVYRSFFP